MKHKNLIYTVHPDLIWEKDCDGIRAIIVEVKDKYETRLLEERNSISTQIAAEASRVQSELTKKSYNLSILSIIIATIMLITCMMQCING